MNIMKRTLGVLIAAGIVALCSCGPKLPELPVEQIKPYFGDAAKTKAIDTAYYEVKDNKGNKGNKCRKGNKSRKRMRTGCHHFS